MKARCPQLNKSDFELLAPAGNFEKMKAAIRFGADAVYLAGKQFGMRSAADNFTVEEIYKAVEYAHAHGKKVYLTLNTIPRTDEYPALYAFLEDIRNAGLDAAICTDLGVIATVRERIPGLEIHISTQASIMSPAAARAYADLGIKRLVLARELTFPEIRAIRAAVPDDVELEAFIHGSMCVSYSGRCLLANEMNGRDGNRGTCSQPCRWGYVLYEEKRPNMPIPIEQTSQGTFIMSSKDMCTISLIPELLHSGIRSFKIEGRMKSAYYAAVVTNTYRMAMDSYLADPDHYQLRPEWLEELDSVSHRTYGTGFYEVSPMKDPQVVDVCGYIREKAYYAIAEPGDPEAVREELERLNGQGIPLEAPEGKLVRFHQKNKVCAFESVEILSPSRVGRPVTLGELYNAEGERIDSAPHPDMIFWCRIPFEIREGDIMRAGSGAGLQVRAPDVPKECG